MVTTTTTVPTMTTTLVVGVQPVETGIGAVTGTGYGAETVLATATATATVVLSSTTASEPTTIQTGAGPPTVANTVILVTFTDSAGSVSTKSVTSAVVVTGFPAVITGDGGGSQSETGSPTAASTPSSGSPAAPVNGVGALRPEGMMALVGLVMGMMAAVWC